MTDLEGTEPVRVLPISAESELENTELLKQLSKNPSADLLAIACKRIEHNPYDDFSRSLEFEVRKLLGETEHQVMVLDALSVHALQNLDPDLAWLLPTQYSDDPIPEYFEKVLTAVACSGGPISIKQLDDSIMTLRSPERSQYARQAINIISSRSLANGVLAAFRFYDPMPMPAGTPPIDLDPVEAEYLKDLVSQSRFDRIALSALTGVLKFFVPTSALTQSQGMMSAEIIPPPPNKLDVCKFILDALISDNSAYSLSGALLFYVAKSPEIDEILDQTDFTKLGDEFHTLPSFSFVPHALMFSTVPTEPGVLAPPTEENPVLRWGNKFAIKSPHDFPAISIMDFRMLDVCRKFHNEITGISLTPPTIEPVSSREFHIEVGTHVLNKICDRYGLSKDPLALDIPESIWEKDHMGLPYSSFSAEAYHAPLVSAVADRLGDPDPAKNLALADVLVCKEQGVIALELYAILLLIRERQSSRSDVTLLNASEILAGLIDELPEERKISRIVDRLSHEAPITIDETNSGDISLEVKEREICFKSGHFRERCVLKSGERLVAESDWIGSIPLSYVHALSTQPHLLDLIGISLTERELRSEMRNAQPVRTPMEAILNAPEIFIARFLQAINDSSASLEQIDSSLRLEGMANVGQNLLSFPISSEKAPNPKPSSIGYGPLPSDLTAMDVQAIEEGFPGGVGRMQSWSGVVFNDAEYERLKPHYLRGFNYFSQFQAQLAAGSFIRPRVDQMPDNLPRNIFEAFFIWAGITERPNWTKIRLLEELNGNNDSLTRGLNYLRAWDIGSIHNEPIEKVYLRGMIIHPSLTKFLATYELTTANGTTRFANFEGKLPPLPAWLTRLIERDPGFLQRYDLDLSGSTLDAEERIIYAARRHYIALGGLMSPVELLDRQSLFWTNSSFQYASVLPILYKSPAGAVVASEITTIKAVREMSSAVPPAPNRVPNPALVQAVKDQWSAVNSVIQQEAHIAADKVIGAINEASRREWVIGLSFTSGGGSVYLGLGFQNSDFGVYLSTSLNGNWSLSGTLMKLPVINWNFAVPTQQIQEDPFGTLDQAASESAAATSAFPRITSVNQLASALLGEQADTKSHLNVTPSSQYAPNILWSSFNDRTSTVPIWGAPELDQRERAYLFQVYMASLERFNPAEQRLFAAAFTADNFPTTLTDLLSMRSSETWESKLQMGRGFFETYIEDIQPTQPDPVTPAVLEENNRKQVESFDRQVASAKERCGTDKCFVDGLPIASVAYTENVSVMTVRSRYKVIDGSDVVFDQTFQVPDFLRQAVVENPNGHALEFYQLASSREFLRQLEDQSLVFANANRPMLEAIDAFMQREIAANSALAREITEPFSPESIPSFRRYLEELNSWLQANGVGVSSPFIPKQSDIAASMLFVPPSELLDRALGDDSLLMGEASLQRLYAPFLNIRSGTTNLQEMYRNHFPNLDVEQYASYLGHTVKSGRTTSYTSAANHSNYFKFIDRSPERLSGYTRNWGDAPATTQVAVMKKIVDASSHLSREDQATLLAIARVESGFNPDAAATTTSASGVYQFIKRTGAEYGLNDQNRFDADANIRAGVRIYEKYLRKLNDNFPGLTGNERALRIYILHHDGINAVNGSATAIQTANEGIIPMIPRFLRSLELQQGVLP